MVRTESYPLLRDFEPGDPFAWREGAAVSAAQFLAGARQIAGRMPAKSHVLNLCEDRYHFALGLAAALLARQVTLLPPSSAAGVLRDVAAAFPHSYCLIDATAPPAGLEWLNVASSGNVWTQNAANDSPFAVPQISADQTAAITFTSGSTGQPTSHPKTWGALVRGALALGKAIGFEQRQARTILGAVPPQHMFGLETTVMLPMQWGCALHTARPLLPADITAALDRTPGARWLMTTPLHLRACAAASIDAMELEGVISATMPLSSELANYIEDRWRTVVHEIYGCTEAGMVAMRQPAHDENWRLFADLRIWQDNGQTWVIGGHVMQAVALTDLIALRGGGAFTLLGRAADLVKIAGKRASLQGLSQELTQVRGVEDGVFYRPDDSNRLVAFAVAPGLDERAILAQLRERVDPAFLPRPLYLVDALPRAATGKLTLESLRRLAVEHREPSIGSDKRA